MRKTLISQKWCKIEQFQSNIWVRELKQSYTYSIVRFSKKPFSCHFGRHLEFLHTMQKLVYIGNIVRKWFLPIFLVWRISSKGICPFFQKIFFFFKRHVSWYSFFFLCTNSCLLSESNIPVLVQLFLLNTSCILLTRRLNLFMGDKFYRYICPLQTWIYLTLNPRSAKVSDVVDFKSAYILLLVLKVWHVKPTYIKSWARNILMWSDLTLGPLFKIKWG